MIKTPAIYCPNHSEKILRVSSEPYSQPRLFCCGCILEMNPKDERIKKLSSFKTFLSKKPSILSSGQASALETQLKEYEDFVDGELSESAKEDFDEAKEQLKTWFQELETRLLDELRSVKEKFLAELDSQQRVCAANLRTFKQTLDLLKENLMKDIGDVLPDIDTLPEKFKSFHELDELVKKTNVTKTVHAYYLKKDHTQDLKQFKEFLTACKEVTFSKGAKNLVDQKETKLKEVTEGFAKQINEYINQEICTIPMIDSSEIWRKMLLSEMLTTDHLQYIQSWVNVRTLNSNLLYRGSEHGFTFKELQKRYEGHKNLLIAIRVKENGEIIGFHMKEKFPDKDFSITSTASSLFNLHHKFKTTPRTSTIIKSNGKDEFAVGKDLVLRDSFTNPGNYSRFVDFRPNMSQKKMVGVANVDNGKFSVMEIEVFEIMDLESIAQRMRLQTLSNEEDSLEGGELGGMFKTDYWDY